MDRFARAGAYPVTLVVAPAGYGKTVALRHFLEGAKLEYVKFALRKEHGNLLGFLRGFLTAIEPIAPKAIKSLTDVYERASSSDSLVTDIASWLEVLLRKYRGAIVLDDLHLAASEPRITELIADLVERRADDSRWIIATRDPLSLPVASWLAYGLCDMPLDEVDLKLTVEEAIGAVGTTGAKIHSSELEELLALTDGWPTAFGFALRASSRTPDLKRAAAGTREMVYSYLAEQVFRSLNVQEQKFLLATALLPSVDLEVLATAGYENAPALLNRLRKTTSFISRDTDTVFHYHDLFRDFLEHQLRESGVTAYRDAQVSAGLMLRDAGRFPEALALLTYANEVSEVVKIATSNGLELFERGFIDGVEDALKCIPLATRNASPELLLLSAVVHAYKGRFEDSDRCFAGALLVVESSNLRAEIGQRYALSHLNRVEVEKALEILESLDVSQITDRSVAVRVLATKASALSFRGQHEEASSLIRDALGISSILEDDAVRVSTLHHACAVAFNASRFDEARTFISACVRDAHRLGLYRTAARAGSLLYLIAYHYCDYAECTWTLSQMKRDAERAGDSAALVFVKLNLYELSVERGDLERVNDLDADLEEAGANAGVRATETLAPAFAMRAAWSADFATSFKFVEGSGTSQSTLARRALRLAEIALYAAAAGERFVAEDSIKILQETLQSLSLTSAEFDTSRVVKARILLALAAILMGRGSTAHNLLREAELSVPRYPAPLKALVRAARAVYIHVETGAGHTDMVSALADLRQSNYGGYARLLESLPLPSSASSPRFAALTKTELRILQSLASGETSRRIAEELGRSSLTIDSHVKSIIRKLACSGRREAIALARNHGIV
jgi:ATP/maltotriose-dependent transcriptional regulator MalT